MPVQRTRPIHNTNSPNFIKLDYQDLTYIKRWGESFKDAVLDGSEEIMLSELTDMEITLQRVELMMQFMEEKRESEEN